MSLNGSSGGTSTEILEGTLEGVTYSHPETHFMVGRLLQEGASELITVVGRIAGPHEGLHLKLSGRWVLNPKFGRQFQFDTYHLTPPSTVEGLRRYLSSGAIAGIRAGMADRIVDCFGEQTLEVLEHAPERLREVKGLGKRRAAELQRVWKTDKERREIAMFLASNGIMGAVSNRIIDKYGADTMHIVNNEPFRMVREVGGIGFRTADQIAQRMGLAKDSPERAMAALTYLLDEAARSGHLYQPAEELLQAAREKLGVPPEAARTAAATLLTELALIGDGDGENPDLYLPDYYKAERDTADRLSLMGTEPSEFDREEIEKVAHAFEAEQDLKLHPLQLQGLTQLADNRLLILTGGPGTGKTTLLNCLMRLMNGRRIETAQAAPTGRAAKRMEEASGCQAKTIHRLLKFDPKYQVFQRNEENPLDARCVIVDEVSMLDMLLAHALVKALRPDSYLILVGDVDQLPAVGPGSVLKDLLASQTIPTITLSRVFRQSDESAIQHNAHRINQGVMPEFHRQRTEAGQDFFLLERRHPEDLARTVVDLYCNQIPRAYGVDPLRDIQILTPMHRGEAGTQNLNRMVQQELKRPKAGIPNDGDRVMQVVNNYDKEVFNGDAGVVCDIDRERDELQVDFDDRLITYSGAERDQLILAYAISVHKSQGSEYPAVIIPLTTQHYMMLQRNLLYTAVTRARKLVVLVGSQEALAQAVRNNRIQRRYSKLGKALKEKWSERSS